MSFFRKTVIFAPPMLYTTGAYTEEYWPRVASKGVFVLHVTSLVGADTRLVSGIQFLDPGSNTWQNWQFFPTIEFGSGQLQLPDSHHIWIGAGQDGMALPQQIRAVWGITGTDPNRGAEFSIGADLLGP